MNNVIPFCNGYHTLVQTFRCGNEYLDSFIHTTTEAREIDTGKTYLFLSDDGTEVIGYYNITTGAVDCYIDKDRYRSGSSVHINCFAIDSKFQKLICFKTEDGKKYYFSDVLMYDCLKRIDEIRNNTLGFAYVTLNATANGYHLYTRNGFEPLDEDLVFSLTEDETSEDNVECIQMYLPLYDA